MHKKISNNSPSSVQNSSSLSLSPLIQELIKNNSVPNPPQTKAYQERLNEQIENSKNHRDEIISWLKDQFNTNPLFYSTLSPFTKEKPHKKNYSKSPPNHNHKMSDIKMRKNSYFIVIY